VIIAVIASVGSRRRFLGDHGVFGGPLSITTPKVYGAEMPALAGFLRTRPKCLYIAVRQTKPELLLSYFLFLEAVIQDSGLPERDSWVRKPPFL